MRFGHSRGGDEESTGVDKSHHGLQCQGICKDGSPLTFFNDVVRLLLCFGGGILAGTRKVDGADVIGQHLHVSGLAGRCIGVLGQLLKDVLGGAT